MPAQNRLALLAVHVNAAVPPLPNACVFAADRVHAGFVFGTAPSTHRRRRVLNPSVSNWLDF